MNQINTKCETLAREVESVPRLYDSIRSLEARVTELRTERDEFKKNGESLQQDLQVLQVSYLKEMSKVKHRMRHELDETQATTRRDGSQHSRPLS